MVPRRFGTLLFPAAPIFSIVSIFVVIVILILGPLLIAHREFLPNLPHVVTVAIFAPAETTASASGAATTVTQSPLQPLLQQPPQSQQSQQSPIMATPLTQSPGADTVAAVTGARVFRPFTHTAHLPLSHVPTRTNGQRLIFVGDVHGMRGTLERLLAAAGFDGGANDHVILVGDVVSKGPDSAGVVDYARKVGAVAVRGNHEDRILREVGHAVLGQKHQEDDDEIVVSEKLLKLSHKKDKHGGKDGEATEEQKKKHGKDGSRSRKNKKVPHGLRREHVRWLAAQPLVLRVGEVEGMGEVVVVHAGLVAGVPLDRQDPWTVLNMRSLLRPPTPHRHRPHHHLYEVVSSSTTADDEIHNDDVDGDDDSGPESAEEPDLTHDPSSSSPSSFDRFAHRRKELADKAKSRIPVDGHGGSPWTRMWNAYQRMLPPSERTTVVYGHDARRGLRIREYTKGLDSGCVKGKQLTALVVEGGPGGVTQRLVQVECDED